VKGHKTSLSGKKPKAFLTNIPIEHKLLVDTLPPDAFFERPKNRDMF